MSSSSSFSLIPSPARPSSNAHHFLSLKLTNTNYLYWKTQLVPYLRGQRLIGYIDGTWPAPALTVRQDDTSVPNPDHTHWEENDQFVMSLLIASLSEDILPIVVGCTTSREIWDVLASALASVSQTRILQLHLLLQNLKQGDLSVIQYLHKLKALSNELSAAGQPLSAQEFNLYVFKGLNSSFRDMVTSLTIRTTPVTYPEMLQFLSSHEIMNSIAFSALSVTDSVPPSSPQANIAQRNDSFSSNNRTFGGRNRSRGRGRFHGSRHSDSRPHQQRESRYVPPGTRCQICNGSGHTAMHCYQRYNHTSAPTANVATTSLADWFPDTGASHHATPDLEALSHHEPYTGTDQLRVGNGKGLSISQIGSSTIPTPSSTPFQLFNVLHVPSLTKSLLSVSQFTKDNAVFFEFHPSHFLIKDQVTQRILLRGGTDSGLYKMPAPPRSSPTAFVAERLDPVCWHYRLGHPHH